MTAAFLELKSRRDAILAAEPRLRARDLAAKLGISEAELVALGRDDAKATRLRPEWFSIIEEVSSLGHVMALTRNESCVHERKGVYGKLGGNAHVALIVGDDIDLRIFLSHWRFGFGVVESTEHGERRSLQFFDGAGEAIHKVYLTDQSDVAAYDRLVAKWANDEPRAPLAVEAAPAREDALPDSEIDVPGFHAAWDALKDTHEFHGLLNKFKVQRVQGLRLAGMSRAMPVDALTLRRVFENAAARETPIMVFVGNPGMIQIHTGPVSNLKPMGPWFNVLDEKFNLHLREDHVASAWIVWKPTDDGMVTSLELFDAEGEAIATLFGKRKPGQPEDKAWRAIVVDAIEKVAA
ncbi:ChuX/HutX family heme-like substrate-binding protein [Parvibaculum sp.]|uniref:hemin-degrading factor n=1 Tax=Parvibaculum sp. TaxID=2024848 RepID=UPI00320F8B89